MQIFKEGLEWISLYWVTITIILHISFSVLTSLHVLMFKQNEHTSLAWIGLVIFSPFLGSLFYWFFGINRIKRLAKKEHPQVIKQALKQDSAEQKRSVIFPQLPKNWHSAIISGSTILPLNYLENNIIDPLVNGDIAYPSMINSINSAMTHIVLSSYIFNYDTLGRQFISALAKAHQRGVIVKVLLDGIGIGYSWRKADSALQQLGVQTARFLPAISFTSTRFINLRNHRKILCIDGKLAYIGGMNLSKHNLVKSAAHPVDDIQFCVTGPVIDQISQVFIEDWYFATGNPIDFPQYNSSVAEEKRKGAAIARVIQDGPDEHYNRIRWTLINALVCAKTSVKIMTPYFIPDQILMASLHAAALRGVSIEIIVPERSNIPFVDWVMEANFSRIMQHGIQVYKNKRPFDHSKIVIIDDLWSFIGSSNWDARSLEFNFEINLECFDRELNTKLSELFASKKQNAAAVIEAEINGLPVYKKLRNNFFRLFSPYL